MRRNHRAKEMKMNWPLSALLSVVVVSVLAGAGGYFLFTHSFNANKTPAVVADANFGWKFPVAKFPITGNPGLGDAVTQLLAYSNIRDPGGIAQGLPVRLKIPSIGVDSAIEDALITPDGRMDVPVGSVNVAWFSLGPHPGQVGSAVIGGHFGISNGKPWVFYNLDKIKIGSKVYIEDDKGDTLAFIVRRTQSFDRNADSTSVFTSSDGIGHLNLITCEGVWNQVNGTYPLRFVVFTDSIPGEGAVVVNKAAAAKPPVKPVIKQSTKPSLPTTAIEPDKATPAPEPSETSKPSESPSETPVPSPDTTQEALDSPQVLVAAVKSLYATPTDAVVSSVLIISIVFMALRIIKR